MVAARRYCVRVQRRFTEAMPRVDPEIVRPVGERALAARFVLVCVGWGAVACAFIGVFVPGMPTTVFVLVAAYCFARSSPASPRGWPTTAGSGRPSDASSTRAGCRQPRSEEHWPRCGRPSSCRALSCYPRPAWRLRPLLRQEWSVRWRSSSPCLHCPSRDRGILGSFGAQRLARCFGAALREREGFWGLAARAARKRSGAWGPPRSDRAGVRSRALIKTSSGS